ncbi:MAG TPA: hypothetical protein PKE40_01150 [Arachnia sp.]|nr:hypothetical protein [Arachnia sp.]HMT84934.1 hypothetical protein [Arachnia sp.]
MAAVDLGRLAQALDDYRALLATNKQVVSEAFAELAGRYVALKEVYDGTSGREFMDGWVRADRRAPGGGARPDGGLPGPVAVACCSR